MRVAQFIPYPTPYRMALWSEVARRCQLTVWAYSFGTQRFPVSIDIPPEVDLRIARTAAAHLRGAETPLLALQGWRPDSEYDVIVIYQWLQPASWQLLRWARKRDIPVVLEFESTTRDHSHRRGVVARARRRFVRGATVCLVPGTDAADAVRRAGGTDDRIIVGDLVPDLQRFSVARIQRNDDSPGHRFIFVGRLIALKNVDLIIRAFAEVATQGDELWVAGDGPERPRLEALAEELGCEVRFLGYLQPDAVAETLGSCHTLVLASRQEVWGMVAAEALACGLHAAVSTRAGIATTIASDPGVFLLEPEQASIARAMAGSRSSWNGPITDPPMLGRTPGRAAQRFVDACEAAVRLGQPHSAGLHEGPSTKTDQADAPDAERPSA